MKKSLFAIAAIALSLAACASIPEPKDPSECLVIIKTEKNNSASAPVTRNYQLALTKDGKLYSIPDAKSSFVMIVTSAPSDAITRIRSSVGENATGGSSNSTVNIPLPYRAGSAVVADFAFVQDIKAVDSNSYTSNMSLREVTDAEKAELLEQLAKDGKLKGWQY